MNGEKKCRHSEVSYPETKGLLRAVCDLCGARSDWIELDQVDRYRLRLKAFNIMVHCQVEDREGR